jgi:hypothetical protein
MPWFKVDDGLHAHRKVIRAGINAMGLWVVAGSWCADQLSDGFIPDYVAQRLDPDFVKHAAALVAAKLWIPGEKDDETGWWFHQWSEDGRQPTAESVNAKRDDARERMAKLRAERSEASKNREKRSQDVRTNTSATSQEVASTPTRPDPTHTSISNEIEETPSSSETASPPADTAPEDRLDAERLCKHLAERIESNGSKRPPITKGWRDAARLMLDKDKRTEADVHAAIDWCQDSTFWRGNILSLPKLREKYDQLRLQAIRERTPPPRNNGPDWEAAMARAEARDAAEEAASEDPEDIPLWKAVSA